MTLADRIADYLAGTGRPLTAREIAAGLQARLVDVITTLQSDERFDGPFRINGRSPKAKGYLNRPEPWEQSGTAKTRAS